MRKFFPLVVALIISLGAHAQESETVLYERLGSKASEVISEYLNGPPCSPGPELAKKQAELAKLVAQATPTTGPMVLEFAVMANSLSAAIAFQVNTDIGIVDDSTELFGEMAARLERVIANLPCN